MTEQEKIETEAITYVKETTLYGQEHAPLGSSAKSYFETEKRCFIAGVNSKISKEILNKKTTLKEQYEQAVNRYIEKFVKKHGYEFTDWVADEVGETACFIEQYYLNFTDIKYDIDNNVEKGLIFSHQDDSVNHHFTVNQEETIDFRDYAKGLRYEHLKTNKMNEKLEQAKEIIAKELNYKDWETCINDQPNYKIEGIMDKVAERYHELMDEWIYLNRNTNTFSDNYDMIVICWVNLQHGKPFFGTDIVTNVFDFDEYYNDYGRIVFKWKPLIHETILLPEEVIDKQTLIEYMNIVGF